MKNVPPLCIKTRLFLQNGYFFKPVTHTSGLRISKSTPGRQAIIHLHNIATQEKKASILTSGKMSPDDQAERR